MRKSFKTLLAWLSTDNEQIYEPTEEELQHELQTADIENKFEAFIYPNQEKVKENIKRIIDSQFINLKDYIKQHLDDKSAIVKQFYSIINLLYLSNEYIIPHISYKNMQHFQQLYDPDYHTFFITNFTDYINDKIKTCSEYLTRQLSYDEILNLSPEERKKYETFHYIRDPHDLYKLQDEIDQVTQLDPNFSLNYKNRHQAFIYINGELLVSTNETQHINLMQDYMTKHHIDDKYYFNADVLKQNNCTYAYGHILYGIALIYATINISYNEVAQKLAQYSRSKVYVFNNFNKTIKRLANKKS